MKKEQARMEKEAESSGAGMIDKAYSMEYVVLLPFVSREW